MFKVIAFLLYYTCSESCQVRLKNSCADLRGNVFNTSNKLKWQQLGGGVTQTEAPPAITRFATKKRLKPYWCINVDSTFVYLGPLDFNKDSNNHICCRQMLYKGLVIIITALFSDCRTHRVPTLLLLFPSPSSSSSSSPVTKPISIKTSIFSWFERRIQHIIHGRKEDSTGVHLEVTKTKTHTKTNTRTKTEL